MDNELIPEDSSSIDECINENDVLKKLIKHHPKSPITLSNLRSACNQLKVSPQELLYRIQKCLYQNTETIKVPLPTDAKDLPKPAPTQVERSKKKKKVPKSPPKRVSFQKVQQIVKKKKIADHERKLLAIHYSVPVRFKIEGVWFAAAKKGHIQVMKQLYKNGHITDTNITNNHGQTAQQIAETNGRGHVAKWLQEESTQTVDLYVPRPRYFRQSKRSRTSTSTNSTNSSSSS